MDVEIGALASLISVIGSGVQEIGSEVSNLGYDEVGRLLGEYDQSANRIQGLVWMNDIPVATIRTDQGGSTVGVFYVHTDHLNAPTKITRPTNNEVIWRWDHDPFGNGTPNEDPDGNGLTLVMNLRFPGQYYDTESGLYQNGFRYYDPKSGRYVTSDPIGLWGASIHMHMSVAIQSHSLIHMGWRFFAVIGNNTCLPKHSTH